MPPIYYAVTCPGCGARSAEIDAQPVWLALLPGLHRFACSECSKRFVARASRELSVEMDRVELPGPSLAESETRQTALGMAMAAVGPVGALSAEANPGMTESPRTDEALVTIADFDDTAAIEAMHRRVDETIDRLRRRAAETEALLAAVRAGADAGAGDGISRSVAQA